MIIDEQILFTSDTRFDPDLVLDFDKLYDLEIIFHDCQMFTGGVHASLEELMTLPDGIRQKTVLMHYGDNWHNFQGRAYEGNFHSWAKEGHTYTF